VYISHGGGLFYILQFLLKESKGYESATEFVGQGIFVSPRTKEGGDTTLYPFYANRYPNHFDIPAVLTARIEAQYLDAVPNNYEAILRSSDIKYLKQISISLTSCEINIFAPNSDFAIFLLPQNGMYKI